MSDLWRGVGQGWVFLVLRFSSVSIILTVLPNILHFVPTVSVEYSQLTALFKGTLLSVYHTYTHIYAVLSHIVVYSQNCVLIPCFGLCWLHPCLIVVYFSTFGRPLIPQ